MTKNKKVLDVSYGVFSCRLEGFDDSLEALKTVASYFRDLSAGDRCFGAEPLAHDRTQSSKAASIPQETIEPPDGSHLAAAFFAKTMGDDADTAPRADDAGANEILAARLHRLRAVAARQDARTPDQAYEEDLEAPAPGQGLAYSGETAAMPATPDEKTQALQDAIAEISDALNEDDSEDTPAALLQDGGQAPQDAAQRDRPAEHDGASSAQRLQAQDTFVLRDDPVPSHARAKVGVGARDSLPAIDDTGDEDLSRLMAEAEHQMLEPEGKTRRSAFEHLRAAVATRFADRSMEDSRESVAKKAVEIFRSDLAEAVKPAGMTPPAHRPGRMAETGVAPLKLVAAQRIGSTRAPVPQADGRTFQESSFDAYAKARGATDLPGLLEAAAAYLAFVKGHKDFSRPQLMSCLQTGNAAGFEREEELKAFGQLLINDKIKRVAGGRFAASDSIGYRPGHRATG